MLTIKLAIKERQLVIAAIRVVEEKLLASGDGAQSEDADSVLGVRDKYLRFAVWIIRVVCEAD